MTTASVAFPGFRPAPLSIRTPMRLLPKPDF